MPSIEVEHITKKFGAMRAVNDVSFTVEPGEIFGLLGPNGAGKTTTIRIILDIFKPDTGRVSVLGGDMSAEKMDHIGYMPEERGLYQDITVEHCLVYLATLKGLSTSEAKRRIDQYLVRFDLLVHRRKKLKELSKGMQQKAQLIAALVHNPELIIIDEPFNSLDPVNTLMVKELLRDERQKGSAIIMCTHQMNQVEELCDRLVLINRGQAVLYGRLNEIRRGFAGRELLVRSVETLPESIPGVERIERLNSSSHLKLLAGITPQSILKYLVERNVNLEQFEIAMPSLDEIFIQVVKGQGETP
jgi:ABC-2 type transport system ATP-binding protein